MRLIKSTVFLYFCLMFITGVAIHSFFVLDIFYVYIFLLFCLIFGVINWQNKFFRVLIFGGVFLSIGFWRYDLTIAGNNPSLIQYYNDQKVSFIGEVIKEPEVRIDNIKLTIESQKLLLKEEKSLIVAGRVLVTTNLYPQYDYGDKLKISCQLKSPEPFEGFSYDRYLARYDIYSLCYYPEIELLAKNQGNYFLAKILQFKNKIKFLVNRSLTEPQASLFLAITLGLRRGIPQDLLDKLAITGIMHLIAISGLHIVTITNVLMKAAPYFYIHRKVAFYLITLFLVLYIIMIGWPASAIRAAIMGFLAMLAIYLGRPKSSLNALVIAATLMLLFNPKILRDDVGFQLSFMATLGIIYFSPIFARWFENWPEKLMPIAAAIQMSLAAQLMTWPLIVYHFGRFSLVAILANVLVVPVLPYFMPVGFLTIGLSFIFKKISWLIFFPVWLFLTYLIKLVEFLASLPLAAIEIKSLPAILVIVSYGFIFYFLSWYNKRVE